MIDMLLDYINDKYLRENYIRKLHESFKAGKPFPNLVLSNFFNQAKLIQFKKAVVKEQFRREDVDLFSFSHTDELFASKNPRANGFYHFFSSPEFFNLVGKITTDGNFKMADMHAHLYGNGDYLLYHDDVVEGRKVAYILNLSQGFTRKDGGALQLVDIKKPEKPVHIIVPRFNTFVLFEVSRKSLHSVEEVKSDKKRLSIGGWFYGP